MILQVLKIAAAIATIMTGLYSLFKPRDIQGFTGLSAPGGRGITELRAVMGGFFIGLGGAALLLNTPEVYIMLGIAYLAVAVVRGVFMFIDHSVERSNIISVVTEVILGVILIA